MEHDESLFIVTWRACHAQAAKVTKLQVPFKRRKPLLLREVRAGYMAAKIGL